MTVMRNRQMGKPRDKKETIRAIHSSAACGNRLVVVFCYSRFSAHSILCHTTAGFSWNDRLEAHAFCSRERAVGRGGRNAIGRLRELRCADRASFLRRWDEHGIGAGGNVQFADA